MAIRRFPRLLFYYHTIQNSLAVYGFFGLLLLLIAAVLYCNYSLPQMRELDIAVQAYKKTSEIRIISDQPISLAVQSEADQYFNNLPNAEKADLELKTIVSMAEKLKLTLDSGKYETLTRATAEIRSLEVSLPLKGNYPQIKRFLALTINALPNAVLSQVTMHRSSVDSTQIEADVVFMFYFKRAG